MAYTERLPFIPNFFETIITQNITASDTVITLQELPDNIPSFISKGDFIPFVIRDTNENKEIIYATEINITNKTITVLRGQENTTAKEWTSGRYIYSTLTSGAFNVMRVNGFSPLLNKVGSRPAIIRTGTNTLDIEGNYSNILEANIACRIITQTGTEEPVIVDPTTGNKAIYITSYNYNTATNYTSCTLQNVNLPLIIIGIDIGIMPSSAPAKQTVFPFGIDNATGLDLQGSILTIKQTTNSQYGTVLLSDTPDNTKYASKHYAATPKALQNVLNNVVTSVNGQNGSVTVVNTVNGQKGDVSVNVNTASTYVSNYINSTSSIVSYSFTLPSGEGTWAYLAQCIDAPAVANGFKIGTAASGSSVSINISPNGTGIIFAVKTS